MTSQVISVAFYREREKSHKFCSEALISAWGSFACRKSTTRDSRLFFPSERSHTQDFYALKKSIDSGRVSTREPRIQWRWTLSFEILSLEWNPYYATNRLKIKYFIHPGLAAQPALFFKIYSLIWSEESIFSPLVSKRIPSLPALEDKRQEFVELNVSEIYLAFYWKLILSTQTFKAEDSHSLSTVVTTPLFGILLIPLSFMYNLKK